MTVRVTPGAKRAQVGGRYGEADPPTLVVKVTAPPVDGKANEAVAVALAEAFGVKRGAVQLESGASSRVKVFSVAGGQPARLDELLGGG